VRYLKGILSKKPQKTKKGQFLKRPRHGRPMSQLHFVKNWDIPHQKRYSLSAASVLCPSCLFLGWLGHRTPVTMRVSEMSHSHENIIKTKLGHRTPVTMRVLCIGHNWDIGT